MTEASSRRFQHKLVAGFDAAAIHRTKFEDFARRPKEPLVARKPGFAARWRPHYTEVPANTL